MRNRGRIISVALAGALLLGVTSGPAAADHDDGVYELPALAMWDHYDLSILIHPPPHGPIYNQETGVLGGPGPNELTTSNTYLKAIEAAIAAWDKAIDALGADWLKEAYQPTVYVLGRDDVPQDVLLQPDILVVTDEWEASSLGTAVRVDPCIVRMSRASLQSFTYADMYNVTAQEFGHCLGLSHVGSQAGVDPTSEQKHPEHDVMNGFYSHMVGAADTHLHCISNLDILGLEHVFSLVKQEYPVLNVGEEGISYLPAAAYGDTCELPPSNWRETVPATVVPGAPPMHTVIASPASSAKIPSRSFKVVRGTATIEKHPSHREGTVYDYDVQVAIARLGGDTGCEWWSPADEAFIARDCYSPLWDAAAQGDYPQWSWKPPRSLSAGRYRVVSRIATIYGNEPLGDDNVVELNLKSPGRRGSK